MEEKNVMGWQLTSIGATGLFTVTFACPFCATMQFNIDLRNLTESIHKCPKCDSASAIQFKAYKR